MATRALVPVNDLVDGGDSNWSTTGGSTFYTEIDEGVDTASDADYINVGPPPFSDNGTLYLILDDPPEGETIDTTQSATLRARMDYNGFMAEGLRFNVYQGTSVPATLLDTVDLVADSSFSVKTGSIDLSSYAGGGLMISPTEAILEQSELFLSALELVVETEEAPAATEGSNLTTLCA